MRTSTEAVIRLLSYVTCPTCAAAGDDHCLITGGKGRRKPSLLKSHRARWDAAGDLYLSVRTTSGGFEARR